MRSPPHRRAFTLWEAAACIGVGALLLAAAVPMARTRFLAQTEECQARIGQLVQGMWTMAVDQRNLPPSYVFPSGPNTWTLADQQTSNPNPGNGNLHWSRMLTAGGYITDDATFTCPAALHGGAPRANPGPVESDWEPGQVNELGQTAPSAQPVDQQAARMAYAANAALMPRNKFSSGGDPRTAQQVRPKTRTIAAGEGGRIAPETVRDPAKATLFTEYLFLTAGGWDSLKDVAGTSTVKSHRPITPFVAVASGTNVFAEPDTGTAIRFRYPSTSAIRDAAELGPGMIVDSVTELNAVGRHHPGDKVHFALLDGSVRLATVRDSITQRLWGERFSSITGNNKVVPFLP